MGDTHCEVKYPGIYENRWKTKYHFLDLTIKRTSGRNKYVVVEW